MKPLATFTLCLLAAGAAWAEEALVSIPVLNTNASRGTIISPDMLSSMDIHENRLNQTVIRHPDALIGMELTRSQRAGALVYDTALRVPPTVRKNAPVVMEFAIGAVELSAQGRALEDGMSGDYIRVMNTSSNNIIYATVQPNGNVSVN